MIVYVLICQWNISAEEGCNVEGVYSSLQKAQEEMHKRMDTNIAEEVLNNEDCNIEESDRTIYYNEINNNDYIYYWIQEKTLDQ